MEDASDMSVDMSMAVDNVSIQDKETTPLLPPEGDMITSVGMLSSSKKDGLSMFEGVFVPCVLSIFSVVLFLRLGYVIGQAGLIVTLFMLVVAYFILNMIGGLFIFRLQVFLTILSISAISTNGLVKGGGAYYMISRSLGPEFGGAIGIIFFFANIFSSGLYVVGFVEALNHNVRQLPTTRWEDFGYGSVVLLFCLMVCIVGAKAFAKASLVIWVAVMISVASVLLNFAYAKANGNISCPLENHSNESCGVEGALAYTRISSQTLHDNMNTDWTVDYTTGSIQSLQVVFAVLFNGCTGIMAGANISGDLKNASVAIPYGTIAASVFTFCVYVVLIVMTAATCTRALLVNDYSYMQDINVVPPLVIIGIFCATLSAALSTLIGASRILQAISRDNLLGDWFLFFSKGEGEPIRAVVLSWFLVQLVLLIGQVNLIAPLVSMLYLISYAITNFACFTLKITGAPNFRPTFHYFTWHTALGGFLGCIIVMFYANAVYAAATCLLAIVLFIFIHVRHIPVDWGDVTQALMYHQVRKYLLRLRMDEATAKYWRPQFLFMVNNPRYSLDAMLFVNEVKKGGLFIVGKVMIEDDDTGHYDAYNSEAKALLELGRCTKQKCFVDVAVDSSVRRGVRQLVLTSGLGTMRPNTLLLGFYAENSRCDQLAEYRHTCKKNRKDSIWNRAIPLKEFDDMAAAFPVLPDPDRSSAPSSNMSPVDYCGILTDALRRAKNVGILRHINQISARLQTAKCYSEQFYIDIWPVTRSNLHSYELLLQLAAILHATKRWRDCTKLRVLSVSTEEMAKFDEKTIRSVLKSLRIEAEVKMVFSNLADAMHVEPMTTACYTELNRLMQQEKQACVIFSYLPKPPSDVAKAENYVSDLKVLTDNLPPIVLMHGVQLVMTHHTDGI